jgi:hypothetical protein
MAPTVTLQASTSAPAQSNQQPQTTSERSVHVFPLFSSHNTIMMTPAVWDDGGGGQQWCSSLELEDHSGTPKFQCTNDSLVLLMTTPNTVTYFCTEFRYFDRKTTAKHHSIISSYLPVFESNQSF